MSEVEIASSSTSREHGATTTRCPGEPGIWVFVLADMLLFALLFFLFEYAHAADASFGREQQSLSVTLGTINTVLLISSSLAVALGVAVHFTDRARFARPFFAGALLCGLGFATVKAVEWTHLIHDGHTIDSSPFYSYYFMLTGTHLLHVVIGGVVLLRMIGASRPTNVTAESTRLIETGGIFWHMVDLLWVVLFAIFYLVR